MTSKELRETIVRPNVVRLKALGIGIKVDKVLGRRLLIKLVIPFTDMDRVEKEGLLALPESVKKANTPTPSTGVVVGHGHELTEEERQLVPEGVMVMFSRFAGTDFTVDEESLRILDVSEVVCTLADTEGVVVPVKEGK